MDIDPNIKVSMEIQQKFEFYFIALNFTLLALAIQSGKFEGNALSDVSEIIGWLFLLTAGLFGLSRLEWFPVGYKIKAQITTFKKDINDCQELASQGHSVVRKGNTAQDINSIVATSQESIAVLEPRLKKINKKSLLKYKSQKLFFALGLIAIIFSRSLGPILSIINTVPCTST